MAGWWSTARTRTCWLCLRESIDGCTSYSCNCRSYRVSVTGYREKPRYPIADTRYPIPRRLHGNDTITHARGWIDEEVARPQPRVAGRRLAVGGARRRGEGGVGAPLLPVDRAHATSLAARCGRRGVRVRARSGGSGRALARGARGRARRGRVRVRDHAGAGDRRGSRDPALACGDPAGAAHVSDAARRL